MCLSYSEVRACHAKSDKGATGQPGDIETQSKPTTASMVYIQSEGHIQGQLEKKEDGFIFFNKKLASSWAAMFFCFVFN